MKESFEIDTWRNYQAHFICLPPNNYRLLRDTLGLISGWGGDPGLHIGSKALSQLWSSKFSVPFLWYRPLFSQVKTCSVIFIYSFKLTRLKQIKCNERAILVHPFGSIIWAEQCSWASIEESTHTITTPNVEPMGTRFMSHISLIGSLKQ